MLLEWIYQDLSGSENVPRWLKGRLVTFLGEERGFRADDPVFNAAAGAKPSLTPFSNPTPSWTASQLGAEHILAKKRNGVWNLVTKPSSFLV